MSILDPALRNALRTLKLTGMLETLDARLAQPRDGTLGHLDFLQVLCEDEIARRESAALTRRIRRARFEEQSTFESFDFTANTKLPRRCCATSLHCAGSTPPNQSSSTDPSASGKPIWHKHLGMPLPVAAATSASPRPPGCSPISPAATPIAPGVNASANTPNRWS